MPGIIRKSPKLFIAVQTGQRSSVTSRFAPGRSKIEIAKPTLPEKKNQKSPPA